MEIVVGKNAGFCYGVKRAVESATNDILNSKESINCLGEIVHNKAVVKKLEDLGVKFVENIEDVEQKTIIRAHGVPKSIYEYAKNNKIELKDYTCPSVLKIHNIAEEYVSQGYYIFLCGSKVHPENIGTISYCGENSFNIEKIEDVEIAIRNLEKSNIKKVALISQTTFSLKAFKEIEQKIKEILEKDYEVIIRNTICNATEKRQVETEELAKRVDFMIIIGGKNSSNTKKLYEISKKNLEKTIVIEDYREIDLKELNGMKKVGIMAGASTPNQSIDEVIELLKKKIEEK